MGERRRGLRFAVSRSNGGPALLTGARRFVEVLSAQLDAPIALSVAYDYRALLKTLLGSGVELAWMPPLVAARAAAAGARLVALSERNGALFYRSALLVRADSPFDSIHALAAIRAAWVDPASASGYLFPRLHLVTAGLAPARTFASERFCGSAADACRAVSTGSADLCACFVGASVDRSHAQQEIARTFGSAAAGLRVLDLTALIPPDCLVVAPTVDEPRQAQLCAALLGMNGHAEGRAVLRELLQADRLAPVSDDVVRALAQLAAQLPDEPQAQP